MGQAFPGQARSEHGHNPTGSGQAAEAPVSAIQQFLNDHDNDSVCGTDLVALFVPLRGWPSDSCCTVLSLLPCRTTPRSGLAIFQALQRATSMTHVV